MRAVTKAAGIAAVVGLVGVLAACGQDTPDGFTEVSQERLKVAVPEEWTEGETSGIVDLVRQDEAGDAPTLRLAASSDYPDSSARGALGQLQALNVLGTPDESGGMKEVDGDRDMWRWDLTTDDGAYHVIAWTLCEQNPTHCVLVTLTGTQEIDVDLATNIEKSIEIVPAQD